MSDANRFRDAADTLPQDWERLGRWLAIRGMTLDAGVEPRQFAGGMANLNYLVSVDGAATVLRRPPAGPVAEGANDMAREARVLNRLSSAYWRAPRGLAYCDDLDVLGAPFQLIEYREGLAIGATLPAGLRRRRDAPGVLTDQLVTSMVELHAVDAEAAGLGAFGRPEGFLTRQIEGWVRRAGAAYDDEPPGEVTVIASLLRARMPPPRPVSLLHGDFKFDNLLVDPDSLEAVAVVDWEMCTRGDSLCDLGVTLAYWIESSDPIELHALEQVPSLRPGFATRAEVAAAYFAAAGREPVDLGFYLGLGRLRLAIAWRQLDQRYQRGALSGERYGGLSALARTILTWTVDTLERDAAE